MIKPNLPTSGGSSTMFSTLPLAMAMDVQSRPWVRHTILLCFVRCFGVTPRNLNSCDLGSCLSQMEGGDLNKIPNNVERLPFNV